MIGTHNLQQAGRVSDFTAFLTVDVVQRMGTHHHLERLKTLMQAGRLHKVPPQGMRSAGVIVPTTRHAPWTGRLLGPKRLQLITARS